MDGKVARGSKRWMDRKVAKCIKRSMDEKDGLEDSGRQLDKDG